MKKQLIDELVKDQEQYWGKIMLNDLVKIKTKDIQTPYVKRSGEEFWCIILPKRDIIGIPSDNHYRLLRWDSGYTTIDNLRIDSIESINDKPLEQKQIKWIVKGSKDYIVEDKGGGKYTCTCPGFTFRKKECKHIKSIK